MSYEAVMERVKDVPEEYLDEVSDMIEYVIYRHGNSKNNIKKGNLSEFFGTMKFDRDPLEIQRQLRNEWN
jgi:hypothetical protein